MTAQTSSKKAGASRFASKMAQSVAPVPTQSVLESLPSRASTESATAPRSEGLKTGTKTNFSGQYLYDRFIANNKEEVTKMDLVRKMAASVDVASFKTCLKDFVDIAKGGEKVKGNELTGQAAATYKTALNHASVLKIAYGAIRFAGEALAAMGYNDTTGYQVMRVMGKQALDDTGVTWDGSKALDKAGKAERSANKLEEKAIAEVMAMMPKNPGESRAAYLGRIDEATENRLNVLHNEQHDEMVEKLATAWIDQCTKAGVTFAEVVNYAITPVGDHLNKEADLDPKAAAKAAPGATKH